MSSPRLCLLLILCLFGQLALAPWRGESGMHAVASQVQEIDAAVVAAQDHCGGASEHSLADRTGQTPETLCCGGLDCDCDCSRVLLTALRLEPAMLVWCAPARDMQQAMTEQLPRHIDRPPLRPPARA